MVSRLARRFGHQLAEVWMTVAGLSLLSAAAWTWSTIAGLAAAGVSVLLVEWRVSEDSR